MNKKATKSSDTVPANVLKHGQCHERTLNAERSIGGVYLTGYLVLAISVYPYLSRDLIVEKLKYVAALEDVIQLTSLSVLIA